MIKVQRCQRADDRAGEGRAYCNLGDALCRLGQFDKAVKLFNISQHIISRELGDNGFGIGAYCNLGDASLRLGRYDKAVEFYTKQINISGELGDRVQKGQFG